MQLWTLLSTMQWCAAVAVLFAVVSEDRAVAPKSVSVIVLHIAEPSDRSMGFSTDLFFLVGLGWPSAEKTYQQCGWSVMTRLSCTSSLSLSRWTKRSIVGDWPSPIVFEGRCSITRRTSIVVRLGDQQAQIRFVPFN